MNHDDKLQAADEAIREAQRARVEALKKIAAADRKYKAYLRQ